MSQQQPAIYGIDIETDTSSNGLDPAVAARASPSPCPAARSTRSSSVRRRSCSRTLDTRLASLAPGVLATWNGATFDLPFIADRARLLGVGIGLHLCLDRRLTLDRPTLPGHGGAYRGAWGHHAHLDTFRLYGPAAGRIPWLAPHRSGGSSASAARAAPPTAPTTSPTRPSTPTPPAMPASPGCWPSAGGATPCAWSTAWGTQEARPVSVAAQRLERQARHEGRPLRPAVAGL